MSSTPRKIVYAREKEQILYESLISLASLKQEELRFLISNTIESNRERIIQEVKNNQFTDSTESRSCSNISTLLITKLAPDSSIKANSNDTEIEIKHSSNLFTPQKSENSNKKSEDSFLEISNLSSVNFARDYTKITNKIQELVLSMLNNAIAQKITESVEILKENYLGTLKRCLKTLEEMEFSSNSIMVQTNSASVSEALQQVYFSNYLTNTRLSLNRKSDYVAIRDY